ncbi:hypothetical protein [Kitasatospora sp. NPDC048407]|uniref:hypothetical protein n=1 Tax=Kitasatospora sp. NPDC048407 TaxID=3364051 RepID=UPI0037107C2B
MAKSRSPVSSATGPSVWPLPSVSVAVCGVTPTTAPTCPAKRTGQAPLIVIDYIGLLAPDRTGRRAENHYAEMTDSGASVRPPTGPPP